MQMLCIHAAGVSFIVRRSRFLPEVWLYADKTNFCSSFNWYLAVMVWRVVVISCISSVCFLAHFPLVILVWRLSAVVVTAVISSSSFIVRWQSSPCNCGVTGMVATVDGSSCRGVSMVFPVDGCSCWIVSVSSFGLAGFLFDCASGLVCSLFAFSNSPTVAVMLVYCNF